MNELKELMASLEKTAYQRWIKGEGVPVVEGFGVEDVREMELGVWRRIGRKGGFLNLFGIEGATGMYVAETPPGGALNPERHIYEEVICILAGQGATEVWQEGGGKRMFEWGPWSVFAPPLNAWHRLLNGGREPVKFLAVTSAPLVMDLYRNAEFVFNCPFVFSERFAGEESYFDVSNKRYRKGIANLWETNFIPDAGAALLESE